MKKIGIIAAISVLCILLFGTEAWASNTTDPHAYSDDPNSCAVCHSTHKAVAPGLIGAPDFNFSISDTTDRTYQVCMFCHNGTGSKYDELDGTIKDPNGYSWATSAGGFAKVPAIEGGNAYASTVNVTSAHQVDSNNKVEIPGNNGAKVALTCTSCHDPHSTSDRELRDQVNVFDTNGNPTFDADGNAITVPTGTVTATVTNPLGKETVTFDDGINNFCGACHTDYLNTGSADQTSGTYNKNLYRHEVGMLPGGSGTNNPNFSADNFVLPLSSSGKVSCLTCHFAHGSSATVTGGSKDSNLLRMDEQGVCENCHRLSPSSNVPAIVSASVPSGDKSKLIITFDQYMLSSTATNPVNYTITAKDASGNAVQFAIDTTVDTAQGKFGIMLQPNDKVGKSVVIPTLTPDLTQKADLSTVKTITVTLNNLKNLNGVLVDSTPVTVNVTQGN